MQPDVLGLKEPQTLGIGPEEKHGAGSSGEGGEGRHGGRHPEVEMGSGPPLQEEMSLEAQKTQ